MIEHFVPSAGVLVVLWFAAASSSPAAYPSGSSAIAPKKTILLFDGKDLRSFYTYLRDYKYEDPKGVFTVQNGLSRISGESWGAMTTVDSYRNYHLSVEWRWGDLTHGERRNAARDSGILVHSVGPDGAHSEWWMASIECQSIEGGCGDLILVTGDTPSRLAVRCRKGTKRQLCWNKAGIPVTRQSGCFNWFGKDPEWKDVLGFRGKSDLEQPAGEWNLSEVICDGASITSIVNGVVVNRGSQASLSEGESQIQSEGADLFIRRIEIAPLNMH